MLCKNHIENINCSVVVENYLSYNKLLICFILFLISSGHN